MLLNQRRRSNLLNILWLLIIIAIQCLLGQHINKSFDIVLVVNGWIMQQQTYHLRRPLTSIRTTTQQQRYAQQQSMKLYQNVPTDTVYGENIYIVTGSNGYIGRAVVHELLDQYSSNKTYDDLNNKVSTSNAATTNNTAMIICLVRSHHVNIEQSYWSEQLQQQQQQQQQCNKYCSIHVFPYDMLDGGETFRFALYFALQLQQYDDLSEPYDTSVNPIRTISSSSLCIFHIASVFGPTTEYEQTAYNNVRGTVDLINILGETINSTLTSNNNDTTTTTPVTMKTMIQLPCKLIITSSMAAVRGTGQVPINQQYYTSDDWNTVSIIHNDTTISKNWGTYYQWSKMESERQAWDLCRNKWKDCIAMVALCPSFVFGPSTSIDSSSSSSSYSITLVDQWIQGISPVQSRLFVDVRDVAKAHVMAAIQPKAIGKRIILSTEARISSQDIAKWLQEEIRHNTIINGNITYDPNKIHYDDKFQGGSIPIGCKEVEATEILQDLLGLTLRPVKDTIVDMAKILLSRNVER